MERNFIGLALAFTLTIPSAVHGQIPRGVTPLNPLISLYNQDLPVFGLYTPRVREGVTPEELAQETLRFTGMDYLFNGSMENSVDRGLPAFSSYVQALNAAGASADSHPLVLKTPKIGDGPAQAIENISKQLNTGASAIVFVGVESATEVRQGLAAMRFASNGGTRPHYVGDAPRYWGLTEPEYRKRADLWPLNPEGELVNWTIVESMEGLGNIREIAAVDGIGVLFPGAGTLRRLFSSTGTDGTRVLDEDAWEAAIQKVLAACKEFGVLCGYPANEHDIQKRMQQGFSVFVIGWGDQGFRTVTIGRTAVGR